MIDQSNRIEVVRESVKHIYIAKMMMRMVCNSTSCGGCPFYNANLPAGARCFFAQLEDVRAEFPTLADMLFELNSQPKHSRQIEEDNNDKTR